MQDYILTGLGISVSLIIYLLTYKQTIGVKQEKIKTANDDISKILIRRIINEDFEFSLWDIEWLIEGKALDIGLNREDLYPPSKVLNSIFTKIVETDFLSKDLRNKVMLKIVSLQKEYIEVEIKRDESEVINISTESKNPGFKILSYILPIVASVLGAVVVSIMFTLTRDLNFRDNLDVLGTTISISAVALSMLTLIRAYKNPISKNDISLNNSAQIIEKNLKFEKKVLIELSKKNRNVTPSLDNRYDYKIGDTLIEIKIWSSRVSPKAVERTITNLVDAIGEGQGKDGIIIVKWKNEMFSQVNEDLLNIKILTLDEAIKQIS